MSASAQEINTLINQEYKQGFVTELETDTFPPGLDEAVIHKLSKVKNEPSLCWSTG
jgi:Fe-S cluster assembly protein SufB